MARITVAQEMKKTLLSSVVVLLAFFCVIPCIDALALAAAVSDLSLTDGDSTASEERALGIKTATLATDSDSIAAAQDLTEYADDPWGFRRSRAELSRDKAVEDIAANIPFLILVREDFGESAHLDWAIPIAEKLPSQPVAVVQLMTLAGGNSIDRICPRMVIEDTISFPEFKSWMERSVASLEAFTMKDANAETTRRTCLQKIKEALGAVSN